MSKISMHAIANIQHIAKLLQIAEALTNTEAGRIFNPLGEADDECNRTGDKLDQAKKQIQKARAMLEKIAHDLDH